MKVRTIEVTICETFNVGNYETVTPQVKLSASLDDDDDPEKCAAELHTLASKLWARDGLIELGWVLARRTDDVKKHEFLQQTGSTRQSLKKLIAG